MKLTEEDKQILREWGNSSRDIEQIEFAANHTTYKTDDGKRISREKAIDLLSRKVWLSGLSRSAFHFNCERRGLVAVHFDSSAIFK